MTGYLSRLAARASGAPAAAGPRLPGRFERDAGGEAVAGGGPDLKEAPGIAPRDAASGPPHPARVPARAADRGEPDVHDTGRLVRAAEASMTSETPIAPAREVHAVSGAQTGTTPGPAPAADATSVLVRAADDPSPSPAPRSAVSAVGPRSAIEPMRPLAAVALPAALPAAAALAVSRDDHPAGRAAQPDVVHVSIGLVEVRATVAAPAPDARPRPLPARGEALSLHDYLRGGRGR